MTAISSAPSAVGSHSHRQFLVPILGAVFATDALTALVVIAYGNDYLINVLKASPSYPAFALGIYGFVKLATAPVGGRVLDRLDRRVFIAAAFAFQASGILVILAIHQADAFLAGVGLLSTGIALTWLLVFHALGEGTDPSARGSAAASMGLVSISATGAGFAMAAAVGLTPHWRVAFVAGLGLAIITTLLLLRVPPQHPVARPSPGAAVATPGRRARQIAGIIIFGHFTAVSGALGALGPFLLRTLDLSLFEAGLLLAPAGVAGAGAMMAAGRISVHGRRLRELMALYAAAGAVGCAMAGAGVVAFAFLAVPFAMALAASQPLLNASLLDVARSGERAGATLGWLFFAEGLGSVVGPVAVGVAIELLSVRAGVALLGGAFLALGLGAALASRRWRI